MATLVELQQEYAFLCGKKAQASLIRSEIWSRLKPIYKAEKHARKEEKKEEKRRKKVFSPLPPPPVFREISCTIGGLDDFLSDMYWRLLGEETQIQKRSDELRTEIVRLGGVVPSCSF